jgi:hypothetical protein
MKEMSMVSQAIGTASNDVRTAQYRAAELALWHQYGSMRARHHLTQQTLSQ